MRRTAGVLAAGLAIAAVAGLTALSSATTRTRSPSPTVNQTVTGSLTIAWSGAPARGCAVAGLCGVGGSLQIRAPGGSSSESSSGPQPPLPQLQIEDDQAAVRVIDDGAGATGGGAGGADGAGTFAGAGEETTCTDLVSANLLVNFNRAHGSMRAVLAPGSTISAGRCAGPVAGDLVGLTLPVHRLGGGRYSLAGTVTTGAGPFTGKVVSTLAALISTSPPASAIGGFPAPPPQPAPGPGRAIHRVLQEQAEYDYRLTGITGSLTTSFAGVAAPPCRALGACGTDGRVTESLAGHGTVSFIGNRRIARPVSAARALRDLRARRMAVYDTLGGMDLQESASEALTGPIGSCRDRIAQAAQLNTSGFRHGAERVQLGAASPFPEPGTDPLRTHCPGPSLADVVGAKGSLGSGTLATGRLGAQRLVIALRGAGAFTAGAYAGRRGGEIRLTFVLVRAHGRLTRGFPNLGFGGGSSSSQGQVVLYGFSPGQPVLQRQIPVSIRGQLTVDFHGDPAAGCAVTGVCGYGGWVSWQPPAAATLTLLGTRSHGQISWSASLSPTVTGPQPESGVTDAAVQLAGAGAPGTSASRCLDVAPGGSDIQLGVHDGRISFSLLRALPSLLDDRCAGPRLGAIASLLPVPQLSLARARRGDVLSLARSAPFSSGGYAGTVQSTVMLSLNGAGRTTRLSGSTGSSAGSRRYRQLTVSYRASLTGSVVDRFTGAPDQANCALLGSCGAAGAITLTPHVSGARATLSLYLPASDPRSWLIGAIGLGDRRHASALTGFGALTWTGHTGLAEQLTQGAERCTIPANAANLIGTLTLSVRRGELAAGSFGSSPGSAPQTPCPGPEVGLGSLRSRSLPAALLRGRTITIPVSIGSRFTDDGYVGSTAPRLTLTLTRLSWRTSITRDAP